MMVRLLIVDGSPLMAWLVSTVTPPGVQVERASSFTEAEIMLKEHPPDAAILNITPSHLNWSFLGDLCRVHQPPIPFLCCNAVPTDADDDAFVACPIEKHLIKPFSIKELRECVNHLIEEVSCRDRLRQESPS